MRALVFSIDDAYVMPFKVLWHSLIKTESIPKEVPIFILHTETLSLDSIHNVAELLKQYGHSATFKDAGSFIPDDLPLSHHFSKATYYRLFIASILPYEITSVVYLDSDALAMRSIRELFYLELTYPIAAADHMAPMEAFRLWGDQLGDYFQSGVMLANLSEWRTCQFEKVFRKILNEERDRIIWCDQDILNIAFENKWQRLPIWYNLSRLARSQIQKKVVLEKCCFLHYDGSSKPWNFLSNSWEVQYWYLIYKESFGKEFDKKDIKRSILKKTLALLKRYYSFFRSPDSVDNSQSTVP